MCFGACGVVFVLKINVTHTNSRARSISHNSGTQATGRDVELSFFLVLFPFFLFPFFQWDSGNRRRRRAGEGEEGEGISEKMERKRRRSDAGSTRQERRKIEKNY